MGRADDRTLVSILSALNSLSGFNDGIETLLTSLNGYVDGLEGFTDGLETLIGSTNTKLDSLISNEACASSSVTQVPSSTSNLTLLSSNASRKAFALFNDSTQVCYIKFGTTSSSSSYTLKMAAGSFYESPARVYTGQIDAIWASANGNMLVTELT